MIGPYITPESSDPPEPSPPGTMTDFFSLVAAPPDPSSLPEVGGAQKTDFASLRAGTPMQPEVILNNTLGDTMVNFITPCLIFIMTDVTLMYLLNVRFIYTSVIDTSLRIFAISLVLGVVALNRVIARQGSNESVLYIIGLFAAVLFYMLATTRGYGVGSFGRNFLNDNVLAALFFNTATITGIWWMVNRLTHECCVDESSMAGDIGIFTATGDRIRWAFQRAATDAPEERKPLKAADVNDPWHHIAAFDPTESPAQKAPEQPTTKRTYDDRLPTRHRGMALFYFSIPVILIFTLGLRVIQHAGMPAVRMGAYYIALYTFCVLFLLSLTCLRQLRAYFALRGVSLPAHLTWLWMGVSLTMILMIMWLAASLPMPSLPSAVYIDQQQIDEFTPQSARLKLLDVTPPTMPLFEQYRLRERLDMGARILMVLIVLYAFLKGIAYCVGFMLTRKDHLPRFLSWAITFMAWFMFKLWPSLFRWTFPRRRIRIQRHIALSSRYDNPMGKPGAPQMSMREHIAYAYDALRALATDIGAPPKASQTPFEFLEHYPEGLRSIRQEAEEIIRLYVIAAYSDMEMNTQIEIRLRQFWVAFRVVRNRYVR